MSARVEFKLSFGTWRLASFYGLIIIVGKSSGMQQFLFSAFFTDQKIKTTQFTDLFWVLTRKFLSNLVPRPNVSSSSHDQGMLLVGVGEFHRGKRPNACTFVH